MSRFFIHKINLLAPIILFSASIAYHHRAFANNQSNIDQFYDAVKPNVLKLNRAKKPDDPYHLISQQRALSLDETLNIPNFLWLKSSSFQPMNTHQLNADALKLQLIQRSNSLINKLKTAYQLTEKARASIRFTQLHNTGHGALIVTFKQYFQNRELFNHKISIVFNRQLQPISISGFVSPKAPQTFNFDSASQQAPQILSKVWGDFTGELLAATFWQSTKKDNVFNKSQTVNQNEFWQIAQNTNIKSAFNLGSKVRSHTGWYLNAKGYPVATLAIEMEASPIKSTNSKMMRYLVALSDKAILQRKNLTHHAVKTYRVWADASGTNEPFAGPQGNAFFPHPTGQDDDTAITLINSEMVSLNSADFSRNDPWLEASTNLTSGNNVQAYVDRVTPDGFTPLSEDHFANETSSATFDYPYNFVEDPNTSITIQNAAIVQAFYVANYIHDWLYDVGFNEAAGNGQQNNYGRGGIGGDPMLVEIQDFANRNNANMSTPSDGGSAKMQVFLWDGLTQHQLDILDPTNLAGTLVTGAAAFGPSDFDVSGQLILVDDGVTDPNEADSTIHDACETPFVNAADLNGKIAVIDRGVCFFVEKISRAEAEGAIAVIIINQKDDGVVTMGAGDNPPVINIPSLMISKADGAPIRAALLNAEVINARLLRATDVDRDAGLDNSLVIHEWGHFLNNRLLSISGTQSHGMDEGWADFLSLLALTHEDDVANIDGAFPISVYATNRKNAPYFGIRRAPYSTNMTINGLTFKHIADGEALPTTMPIAFGSDGADNSEVHATGEVWASMLWEGYVGLIKDSRHSFSQAQILMKQYLVASLKATPANPNFVEARDALLSVVAASDSIDSQTFLNGFAKRGLGIGAISPAKTSETNFGPTESFNNNNPVPPPPPSSGGNGGGGGGAISWLLLLLLSYRKYPDLRYRSCK